MEESSSTHLSASTRIQDFEYLYASNTNVSNFVSVKLSGSKNYHVWRSQMLCLLDSNNMGGIVDANFVGPKCSGSDTPRQYDSLARGWILGSVSEDVLADVHNLGSAKAVWEKLKSVCDPSQGDSTPKVADSKQDINVVSMESNTLDQGANPIEIIVGKDIDPTETQTKHEDTKYIAINVKQKKKLRDATTKGDWSKVKSILKKDESLATEAISSDGSTILHIAIERGQNGFLKKLLSYINNEQMLQRRDFDGSTALHIAAIVGNTYAAKLLVKKNNKLLRIKDRNGKEPLDKGYQNMHLDTVRYLLKVVSDNGESELQSSLADTKIVVDLLVSAISAKEYSLASELVQKFPEFASKCDDILVAIAKTYPSAKASFSFSGILLYILFTGIFIFALGLSVTWDICLAFALLCIILWKLVNFLAKRKEFNTAKKVLWLVCDEIDKLDYSGTHHPYYTRPILEAGRQNADKVVAEVLSRSPEAIQSTDENGYDVIQLAIMHRSEKVYNLIFDISERKNLYRTFVDSSKNNILHLAGKLAPSSILNQRTGAALQLQRELQWREEVKKLVFPTYITQENIFKETPDMVFSREHKGLVKEGEQWMKTTAESCSITAALITTIVFAAAITVPGGNHQDKGTPLFRKKTAFIVFAVADTISLFASSTALLVFLSILTARFSEKDFLISLPRRLFIGLFSLLLSTTAMMVAFGATLFLVFCHEHEWTLVPICGLAFIPIAFFVGLQFPLMVDLFKSTYMRTFSKQRKNHS